jgi:hypothetical protein
MRQLAEWTERIRENLEAIDGSEIHRTGRPDNSKDIARIAELVDERLAEAIRREGEF